MEDDAKMAAMIAAREILEAAGITAEWIEDGDGHLALVTDAKPE